MNVRDSEVIVGLLTTNGYRLTDNIKEADIVIFNTCSVRQHAEEKVWSCIGSIVKKGTVPKKRGQSPFLPIIGIVGCMAQSYKEEIFKRAPDVDFVVGPTDIEKIVEILAKIGTVPKARPGWRGRPAPVGKKRGQSLFLHKIWETDGEVRPEEIYHSGFYEDKEHAYVVISEGCSNYCSYCVVPYVRGQLRHRNYQDILKEIEEAVNRGIKKITLLGQNVNAYISEDRDSPQKAGTVPIVQSGIASQKALAMTDRVDFIKLLKRVNMISGLKEFTFVTSHPKDASTEFFKQMASLEKLKKYLHLPVQAGSDRILKLMHRGYTKKYYLSEQP